MFSSDYKLAFVTVLQAQAAALSPAQTLLQALVSCATARIDSTKQGRALISASSNGKVVAYAMPATAGATSEVAIAELCGELIRLYGLAKQRLVNAGTATPTDIEITTELIGYLEPITEYTADYSDLR